MGNSRVYKDTRKLYFVYSIVLMLICVSCSTESNHPTDIKSTDIISIKIGMSKSEVIGRLGTPIDSNIHLYTYTKRYDSNYPMLWVHFNELGRVNQVYAKYYYYVDDEGIYGLKFDSITNKSECWGASSLRRFFP